MSTQCPLSRSATSASSGAAVMCDPVLNGATMLWLNQVTTTVYVFTDNILTKTWLKFKAIFVIRLKSRVRWRDWTAQNCEFTSGATQIMPFPTKTIVTLISKWTRHQGMMYWTVREKPVSGYIVFSISLHIHTPLPYWSFDTIVFHTLF